MLTKLKIDYVALSMLALLFESPSTFAEAIANNNSPYRLNVAPIKTLETMNPAASASTSHSPQLYQLEDKYRSQSKQVLTTKAEPITKPSSELAVEQTTRLLVTEALGVKALNKKAEVKLEKKPFSNEIAIAANATSLDPALIHALIYVESRYQHSAISPKGAVGLMQVLPDTAARYGIRHAIYLPKGNIKAGTLYLRDLMVMFDNRLDLVLAAYNAGEGAVKKHARQIPPYPETRHYVKAVMAKYASNTGDTTANKTQQPDKHNTQEVEPPPIPSRTRYLSGTELVISNEAFVLNR
jgi:soluble lytic murein transglycosylase-like protein